MMSFRIICTALVFAFSGVTIAEESQKAVLVTGASSGSGRVIAETLAERGYYVYAGARKQADLDELNAIENIHAIRLGRYGSVRDRRCSRKPYGRKVVACTAW